MKSLPLKTLSDYATATSLVYCSLAWIVLLFTFILSKFKLHKSENRREEDVKEPVGVSVIKPLCGLDPNLKENLASFFRVQYSRFEILVCVQEESDPAVRVAKEVIEQFPGVDAKLLVGGEIVGSNPKVNNVHQGYVEAKYPFVLFSDSNLQAEESTLLDFVSCITKEVAVVYQTQYTSNRPGFAPALEKLFFASICGRINLLNDCFGARMAGGMSCLLRKSALDKLGGVRAYGEYIAEDLAMSHDLKLQGWKIALSHKPCLQNSGICEVGLFHQRLVRWIKIRTTWAPPFLILEILVDCLLIGIVTVWTFSKLFHFHPMSIALAHSVAWCIVDYYHMKSVQNGPLNFSVLTYIQAWICQTICAPYLILRAILTLHVVQWKHNRFLVSWGGKAVKELKKLV